jgi:uncharacterized protein (TIGR02677 family)
MAGDAILEQMFATTGPARPRRDPGSRVMFESSALGAVPEARYLVAERAEHYRTLLRVFDDRQRAEYATQLSAQEVFAALSPGQPGWTVDRCRHDLDQLVAWGNLERSFDRSARHSTIDSFRSPAVLYRATPFTLALERFLATQELADERVGRFRHADLPDLLEAFAQLDGLLAAPQTVAADRAVAHTWYRAEALFQRIERDAARYLRSLETASEAATTDVPAFQAYKAAVVTYVQSFATQIHDAAVQLRARFERWAATGGDRRLIACLVAAASAPTPWPRPLQEREAEAAGQVRALAAWCRPGASADHLVRRARAEIATVILRAHALAEQAQTRATYVDDLDALAHAALAAPDVQAASRLASVALGHEVAGSLPAGFGTRDAASTGSVWAGPAAVALMLHPIDRPARASERSAPAPVDDAQLRQALAERERARRAAERRRITRLFPSDRLSIRSLVLQDPADCALVLGVVRYCFQDPQHRTRLADGSTVQIVNPETTEWTTIETPRQRHHLPAFVLRRHGAEAQIRGPAPAPTTLASRAA